MRHLILCAALLLGGMAVGGESPLVIQGDRNIHVKTQDASLLFGAADPKTARLEIVEGMNHVFKPCDSMDKAIQIPTYMNPELKNHPALAPLIVQFIRSSGR